MDYEPSRTPPRPQTFGGRFITLTPHDLYAPKDAQSGGPFTIGRVIHSGLSVGFTGWIGEVAVFDRALSADELVGLAAIRRAAPLSNRTS